MVISKILEPKPYRQFTRLLSRSAKSCLGTRLRGERHAIIYTLARYVDKTFFVTQDREKSTHPVEGAAAQESVEGATDQESTDSVERPTIRSFPSSSGRSASTLSGGAAHHKFCACFSPPTLYCCARL